MDSENSVIEAEQVTSAVPATLQSTSDNKQQLRDMLSNARNTKTMLEDFIAALHLCTVSGGAVYRLAIGIQFIEQLKKNTKNDIERLQNAIDGVKEIPNASV
jgi:hypothetical protein